MPRRFATANSRASSVNGEGSLSAVEMSPIGMPSRQIVMSSTDVHGDAAGAEDFGRHAVGVVAAIDRVARDQRDGGGAVRQDGLQPRVVVLRHAEPDQLALRPGAAAMHGRIDAARHRQLAGEAQRLHVARVARVARPVLAACRSPSPRCRSGCAGWACRRARPAPRPASARAPRRNPIAAAARVSRRRPISHAWPFSPPDRCRPLQRVPLSCP